MLCRTSRPTSRGKTMNKNTSVDWIEEIDEQSFDAQAFGACSTNTFSYSDHAGNDGGWCTLTVECMAWC
ncbi:plantaricin C family lantibiotic [Luteipulveratus sp. YIM 133132]|uniref:plantaricin C family lantibiotic n=1 Tax=Luteipulveratus flavus TaxID=3031728 RepID=UPI0023AF2248|nr:plantaricin C family lantibiotic [Luteipulveratus sp. YIM 133132]MDE9364927.1 plantaricin C family lantibiotic [Luteipulveratus sp. YIM 133132]